MKVCVVYKYEYKGKIIYVGKSDCDLGERIKAHRKDEKFQPYLDDGLKIFYFTLPNPAFTTIYETYLINKYRPRLNEKMKYDDVLFFDIPELSWIQVEHDVVFGTYITTCEAGVYKSSISFKPQKYSHNHTENIQLYAMIDELKAQISNLKQENRRLDNINTKLQIQADAYKRNTMRNAVMRLQNL